MTSTASDRLGYLLGEVIRELPEQASVFLKNVGFVIEDKPASGPPREADWNPSPLHGNQHLSQYWNFYPPTMQVEPLGRMTLYADPIFDTGEDTKAELHRLIRRLIEAKQGVDPGALDRPVGDENFFWQSDDPDQVEELVKDPGAPDASDSMAELAESEVEPMSIEAREWFDDVEIAAVDEPEAKGDPARLADYPEPGDEPKALVLYSKNILRQPAPPEETVRSILHEALRRAGVNPK